MGFEGMRFLFVLFGSMKGIDISGIENLVCKVFPELTELDLAYCDLDIYNKNKESKCVFQEKKKTIACPIP